MIVRLEMQLGIRVVENLNRAMFAVRAEAKNTILKIAWWPIKDLKVNGAVEREYLRKKLRVCILS